MPNEYLGHYAAHRGMGLRESINAALAADATAGDGLYQDANFEEIRRWGLSSLVETSGRDTINGWGLCWELAPRVTREDMVVILEAIEDLCGYCVLDDMIHSDMQHDLAVKSITEWCERDDLPFNELCEVLEEYGQWPEVSNDYGVWFNLDKELEGIIIDKARERASTWNAHYAINEEAKNHYVENCWYCKRAQEGVA